MRSVSPVLRTLVALKLLPGYSELSAAVAIDCVASQSSPPAGLLSGPLRYADFRSVLASFQTAIRDPVVVISPRRIVEQHMSDMPVARVL